MKITISVKVSDRDTYSAPSIAESNIEYISETLAEGFIGTLVDNAGQQCIEAYQNYLSKVKDTTLTTLKETPKGL